MFDKLLRYFPSLFGSAVRKVLAFLAGYFATLPQPPSDLVPNPNMTPDQLASVALFLVASLLWGWYEKVKR